MRSTCLPPRALLPRAIACLSLALLAFAADAQFLPGGAQLGMNAQQLREAVPALQRVPRPVHMAGGLAGNWRGPALEIAGVPLAPTFFFADGELRRVEYVADARSAANAYESLLAWGRASWGPELASQGTEGTYAAWTTGQVQAYLQQSSGTSRAQLRLVVKLLAGRDGSEL
ncbi:hypothetical protein [Ramlibacter sp.]|uniref:hypothetical protein n=1 Tax=Ramlibacter sp. TaxID=1917967 RepID=UPI00260CDCB9|nr:hypothetical protein [Ramlibacter sp.]MDB5958089.1 hypothetical protein [Ramlibacter sp.]